MGRASRRPATQGSHAAHQTRERLMGLEDQRVHRGQRGNWRKPGDGVDSPGRTGRTRPGHTDVAFEFLG